MNDHQPRAVSSPLSSPVLEPKEDKVSSPTQGNSSVSEYIKMIKLYAISVGKDLDDIDIKEKFLVGLSPDNEKPTTAPNQEVQELKKRLATLQASKIREE
ncbi:12875_t:CDS:2, partial [Cetraspora pellucida]